MASDEQIGEALESIFYEASLNPNTTTITSFNHLLHQLQSILGFDLTHKLDFIRTHIHFLLQPPPQPPPPPPSLHLPPPKPHFYDLHPHLTSSQHPSNVSLRHPNALGCRRPQSPPVKKTEASFTNVANTASASATDEPKDSTRSKKKRRGGPGGLNKLCGVSPQLQAIVGQPTLSRTEIVRQLWAYIKKNNLQDPANKRKIVCNDELRLVFETDCTDMFKMNKLLAKHIIALEPTKQKRPKKLKVDLECGSGNSEYIQNAVLSDALANFFGTGEREMSQAEVLRRVWEYIKVNRLEDPLNALVIVCDARLEELFGCGSISALGIPEMLARHHLFRS